MLGFCLLNFLMTKFLFYNVLLYEEIFYFKECFLNINKLFQPATAVKMYYVVKLTKGGTFALKSKPNGFVSVAQFMGYIRNDYIRKRGKYSKNYIILM